MEEGGDDDNHAHDIQWGQRPGNFNSCCAGAVHLVTDAVIVDDDVAVEEGGGRVHEHDEDKHWSV